MHVLYIHTLVYINFCIYAFRASHKINSQQTKLILTSNQKKQNRINESPITLGTIGRKTKKKKKNQINPTRERKEIPIAVKMLPLPKERAIPKRERESDCGGRERERERVIPKRERAIAEVRNYSTDP